MNGLIEHFLNIFLDIYIYIYIKLLMILLFCLCKNNVYNLSIQ